MTPIDIREQERLARYTSWRIGGPARFFADVTAVDQLCAALEWAHERGLPVFLLGGGTNTLVRDSGFDGMVVRFRAQEVVVEPEGDAARVRIDAGAPTAGTVRKLARQGWAGLEWAEGLPGTIGGAVYGNAGCYGGDIASVLTRAWLLVDGEVEEWTAEHFNFSYRTSVLKQRENQPQIHTDERRLIDDQESKTIDHEQNIGVHRRPSNEPQINTDERRWIADQQPKAESGHEQQNIGVHRRVSAVQPVVGAGEQQPQMNTDERRWIADQQPKTVSDHEQNIGVHQRVSAVQPVVLAAEFRLYCADPDELAARMAETAALRRSKTPAGQSCGSVFKNPPGDSAGRLIEAAGLKGMRIGGAEIAQKHANYIVNRGGATSDDVLRLTDLMRERVLKAFGVELELEVQVL